MTIQLPHIGCDCSECENVRAANENNERATIPSNLANQSVWFMRRIRRAKAHVFVHPYRNGSKCAAFAWVLTDCGRERVNLHPIGVAISEGWIRVMHVFSNGDLLYEAAI